MSANRSRIEQMFFRRTVLLLSLVVLGVNCGTSSETHVIKSPKSEPEVRTVILDESNMMLASKTKSDLERWYYVAAANEYSAAVAANEARERAAAEERESRRPRASSRGTSSAPSGSYHGNPSGSVNGYPCGGDLPPCYVLKRESGGNPRAENPVSSASGLWQFLDGTWNNFGGVHHASEAPPEVQNEKARQVWAGGAGASHWACC